jgi:phosphohistidine swiveling domain-containing protein
MPGASTPARPDSAGATVLNQKPERPVTWTTVNAGEAAFPGVPTPLSWTWSWWPTEYGIRGCFAAIGAFPRGFARRPEAIADRVLSIQHGHVAINVDIFRAAADALPGTSGDEVERSYFGSNRPDVPDRPRFGRYPVVAARMPVAAAWALRAMRGFQRPTHLWWQGVVAAGAATGADAARGLLREAQVRYARIARPHVIVGMVSQGLYDQVVALCEKAGIGDRAGALVPGGADEGRWLAELWQLAHARGTLERFLAEHGYHGPFEGELSSRSWRIDPEPLVRLLEVYRTAGDRENPQQTFARRARERAAAEAELLTALPRSRRGPARATLHLARAYMPLRESGRATFLRAYDVARLASRAAGRALVRDGVIAEEEDVFFLTLDELTAAAPPRDASGLVAARRDLRAHYQSIALPNQWQGDPSSLVVADTESSAGGGPVHGIGAGAGITEGPVRVVLDPGSPELEPGEVLVCRTTDPSWASLFYLASAVVMDLGGAMSHGAIVARELGLPAVVSTGDGTRRLKTGEVVRVDGSAGTVTRL